MQSFKYNTVLYYSRGSHPMHNNIRVPSEGEPQTTDEQGDIHFDRRFDPRTGLAKVVVETEYEAKDDMNALDRDSTQRKWESHHQHWVANLKELNRMAEELSDTEHTVTVSVKCAKAFEEYSRGGQFLPERR